MSKNQLSLLARFDDFCRQTSARINEQEIDISKLIEKTEENRVKWLQAETELWNAKKLIQQLREQNTELDSKLQRMRRAYGREVYKAQNHQKDSEKFQAVIDLVKKTVNDEIKGSKISLDTTSTENFDYVLSILNHPDQYIKQRKSQVVRQSLSFDNIDDEELLFDKTEDSLDRSLDELLTNSNTRTSTPQLKPVIKLPTKNSISESETDPIEADFKPPSNDTDCDLSCRPTIVHTPNAVYSSLSLRKNVSRLIIETDLKRLDSRPHKLASKKFFKSASCNVCDKRIGFCSTAYACEECRSVVHSACQKGLKLPCIPHFSPKKNNRQLIGDFISKNVRPFVPPILIYCCKEIESRGLKEVGIYRACGSEREIRELKSKILKSSSGCPNLHHDVHVLCGVVKSFLIDLAEPLVSSILWTDFIRTTDMLYSSNYSAENESRFVRLLNRLPDANRDVIAYIILHLKRVADSSDDNQMPLSSLAKIFAPTIVGWSSGSVNASTYLDDNPKQIQCMNTMLSLSEAFWRNILEQPKPINAYDSLVRLENQSIRSPSLSIYSSANDVTREGHGLNIR